MYVESRQHITKYCHRYYSQMATSHGSGSFSRRRNWHTSQVNIPTGGKKMFRLRFQLCLSRCKYKEGSGPCCKFISYPFLSLTSPATLTSGLYLFPKTQTCTTLVQFPSSFSSSLFFPSSSLLPHSAAAVFYPRVHAILQASYAVLPRKPYVFLRPALS